jgi:hypothetical protein
MFSSNDFGGLTGTLKKSAEPRQRVLFRRGQMEQGLDDAVGYLGHAHPQKPKERIPSALIQHWHKRKLLAQGPMHCSLPGA